MKRLGKEKIQICYAQNNIPTLYTKSIFLAGPTLRTNLQDRQKNSWRIKALEYLKELNYDGVVFVPEDFNKEFDHNALTQQIEWEQKALAKADCILMYLERTENNMGLTSNIEFGMYSKSGKIVCGFTDQAIKNNYIKHEVERYQIPFANNLKELCKLAIEQVKDGSLRKNAETDIPLCIWNGHEFQDWYRMQKSVGNELRYADLDYVFIMPKARKVFFWVLKVHVYIKAEDRIKENEFIISRKNMCSAVLYKKEENIMDSKIVMAREFRSPVCNDKCFVYELPGGSSTTDKDDLDVVTSEIKEEIGLDIDKSRIVSHQTRQCVSTLSIHKCHLYSIELTNEELNTISKNKQPKGVVEDTEMVYTEIFTLKEILENELLDWNNIGQIMSILR